VSQKLPDEKTYDLGSASVYRSTVEHFARPNDGRWSRAHLYHSTDAGGSWHEIPLTISWRSWLVTWATHWPPITIDEVEMAEGVVSFVFHDREDGYEKSPLPFRWGDESLWRARLLPNGRWRVGRIRHLDFEGEDRHFCWED
jgi:hypothetical protein